MVWRDDDPPHSCGFPRLGHLRRREYRLDRIVRRAKLCNHRNLKLWEDAYIKAYREWEKEERMAENVMFHI
jgi:hypothetical protein